jgi:hypothetical protein
MTFENSVRTGGRNILNKRITVTNLQHATHINYTEWVSFKKTIMNDLNICKILAR